MTSDRQRPTASYSSNAMPQGSIFMWHEAQAGLFLWSSMRSLRVILRMLGSVRSISGTAGGAGGGGSWRMFSRSQIPRLSGWESLPSEFMARMPGWVRRPPRVGVISGGSLTLRKWLP